MLARVALTKAMIAAWPPHRCTRSSCRREGAMTSKPQMILTTLVATAGYLGLAIWGAGGFPRLINPIRP